MGWFRSFWWRRRSARMILEAIHQTGDNIRADIYTFRGEVMAQLQEFKDALAAVDAETTRIGDYILQLLEQQQRTDLTADQEAEVLASLTAAANRLKAVGTSVEEPVPTEPLPEPPVVP